MKIDELLNQIENIIEEGKTVFGSSKVKIDAEALRSILNDIRVGMPEEVINARKVAAERKIILNKAADEADLKIKQAEAQARKLVEEHEITKNAQLNADEIIADAKKQAADIIEKAKANSNEIVDNAQKWGNDLRSGASVYVDTIMNASDEILSQSIKDFTKNLNKIRIALQQLKAVNSKKTGQ